MKKISTEKLIEILKKKQIKLNRTPTINDFKKSEKGLPSFRTIQYRFKGFNNALLKAGMIPITYKHGEINKTNEVLLNELKYLSNKLGRTPYAKELKKNGLSSCSVYIRKFGSYNHSLKLCNLDINNIRKYSKKDLLDKLKNFSKQLNRTPTAIEINNNKDMSSTSVFQRKFGSLSNAIKLIGFKPNMTYSRPHFNESKYKDELLTKIKGLSLKIERTPSDRIVRYFKVCAPGTLSKYFGSYNNAMRMVGLIPNKKVFDEYKKKFWKAWQNHCEQMATVIYKRNCLIFQKSNYTDKKPDIFVIPERKHVDAKISGYDYFQEQIYEYTKEGCSLDFWCIWKGIETINPSVKYYYAEELAGIMNTLGRDDLTKKCYLFKNNIIPDCYQKELDIYIKNQQ